MYTKGRVFVARVPFPKAGSPCFLFGISNFLPEDDMKRPQALLCGAIMFICVRTCVSKKDVNGTTIGVSAMAAMPPRPVGVERCGRV